jgi:hypothetical protein
MGKTSLFAKADRNIEARTSKGGHEAPPVPDDCSVIGCKNEAVICMAVCEVEGSGRRVGPGSDFMGAGRIMHSGVTFVRWISRCAQCYDRDLQRSKTGVYSKITDNPDGVPTLEEARRAREQA